MNTTCTPRIYVACLAAYNAGTLHGRWIECDQVANGIRTEIKEMLSRSPEPFAEEWAIHDYEYFGGVSLHEFECLDDIAAYCEARETWGDLLSHVVNHCGGIGQLDEAIKMLGEEYAGEADSVADWSEDFLEETGQLESVPENLRYYIDFARYARDMELSGDIFTIEADSNVHVFWKR